MTDLAVTEVDEKQQQRLETFLNTKKKLGEPKNDPDEYEKSKKKAWKLKKRMQEKERRKSKNRLKTGEK